MIFFCFLSQQSEFAEEEVWLYRLTGQRLGLGLRFVGGTTGGDPFSSCVRALYVQSTSAGSPAAGARCAWGRGLRRGDRVLAIAGQPVHRMTRTQCVDKLRGEENCFLIGGRNWDAP